MNEEEEEDLCDAVVACAMKDEVACAMEVAGAGDDDDDDDNNDKETSTLFKEVWKKALKLSPEELTRVRDNATKRLSLLRNNGVPKLPGLVEQKKRDKALAKAQAYLAEMIRWKGADKEPNSSPSEYYLWYKWNTDTYLNARKSTLKCIEEAGLPLPDDEAGAPAPAPAGAKAGKGAMGAKGGKDGKDGAK